MMYSQQLRESQPGVRGVLVLFCLLTPACASHANSPGAPALGSGERGIAPANAGVGGTNNSSAGQKGTPVSAAGAGGSANTNSARAGNGAATSGSGGSPASLQGGAPAGGARAALASGGTSAASGAGASAGAGGAAANTQPNNPGTFKVFDKIPQFGMYATSDPKNYTPPSGTLMWSFGTVFVNRLSAAQRAQIGADLKARVTYHAQCDNYDRIGGVFLIRTAPGVTPKPGDPRVELVRFITPFSDYSRDALATYAFPLADLSEYARTLTDPAYDSWIGIGGGSNPYGDDPCERSGNHPDDFKAVGFLYSLEFMSEKPLPLGQSTTLPALYNVSAKMTPVTASFMAPDAGLQGKIIVIVSGHGSKQGGVEYMNTQDSVSLNGNQIGMFSTKIDCAQYARFSPDGNQGIFQGNNAGNPRNWCPGALVPTHVFPATLKPGSNTVGLDITPSAIPMDSFHATSINYVSE